jgi:ubiquitin carboxyl-terminal hydrolase 8
MDICNEEGNGASGGVPQGLSNIGNSCFMNSILQCLNAQNDFKYSILQSKLCKSKEDESKGSVVIPLQNLFRTFENGALLDIRKGVGFEDADQEDAHEFLLLLFDKIHTETKRNAVFNTDMNSDAFKAWKKYCETDFSSVVRFFYGQYKTKSTCSNCNANHSSYEAFGVQGIEVPSQSEQFQTLLNTLKEPQYMEDYKCEKCLKVCTLQKETQVSKYPDILAVQLKRFQYTSRGVFKKHTLIEVSRGVHFFNKKYKLVAVCNHHGSANSGHYTATVVYGGSGSGGDKENWYLCDDETVLLIPKGKVVIENAYILFYKKTPSRTTI